MDHMVFWKFVIFIKQVLPELEDEFHNIHESAALQRRIVIPNVLMSPREKLVTFS